MKEPMLQIRNLWKEYGDNIVLERLNLNVNEGEFVSIVGASGCGKTTFLNLLLGTEPVSRGEVLLDGQPLRQEPGVERGIVFQKYSVFPHLTVLENVMIGLEFGNSQFSGRLLGRAFGRQRQQARQQACTMLEQVGLSHAEHQYPHQLSGGMRQRLSIAQSLVKQPRILLLDEPFGALDPGIRKDMHELVRELWQEQHLTVFMITHDLSEGFHLGSRIWVFDHPRLDPQSPERYGAQVTFDIPLHKTAARPAQTLQSLTESFSPTIQPIADAI
ncbi:ABC transporter ATP-binding protein [Vibrio mangrovi]|uniref:ABC transporter ATP-binding protein n=1 Tax=Vibrio mangrovi TaxID=474394 RepID=A0A1Y6IYK3_9VIBR|nr:ABC transporter ATP-binding protein [Vibrio mangrovi]MDW6002383.1 ABC transporter ATP-binding protein [Vibrio mangrovi]SMS02718.1 Bicarbonate transport ATP-binding protein CmpD [Vibrio mangrovi]